MGIKNKKIEKIIKKGAKLLSSKRKLWILPLPVAVVVLVVVALGGVGIVGALNGWFGGGGSIPEDTFTRGLVGYWSFDEGSGTTLYDATDNANHGVLKYMSTNTDAWTSGKVGGALKFDGTEDYVSVPHDNSQIPSHITIEGWYKTDVTDGSSAGAIIVKEAGGEASISYKVYIQSNKFEFYMHGANVSTVNAPRGAWTHFACTYDQQNWKIYINGKLDASGAQTAAINITSEALLIGKANPTENPYQNFDGLLDEIRIYNRALSAEEVRYHYNRGGPVAHWKFDEGSGSTAYNSAATSTVDTFTNGTLYGEMATSSSPSSGWTAGRHGSALAFDGVDDYVVMGSGDILNSANNQITLEAWINLNELGRYQRIIQKKYGAPEYGNYAFEFDSTNVLKVRIGDGSGDHSFYGKTTLDTGHWYHIAAVYDGSRGSIYINGLLDVQKTDAFTINNVTNSFQIGGLSGADLFNGIIDDVRVYNYARTQDEIRLDYNAGFAARFGPLSGCDDDPGSCMTEGLVGYWNMDEGSGAIFHDYSGNNNNATTSGTSPAWTSGIISNSGGKKGGGAIRFDGDDDFADLGSVQDFRNKDFAISFWLYSYGYNNQGSAFNVALANGNSSSGGAMRTFSFVSDSSNYLYFGVSEEWAIYYTNIVGRWIHVVGVQDVINNEVKIYINGKLEATTATTRELETITNIYIGSDDSTTRNLNCLMDEIRIYNRVLSAAEVRYHYNRGEPVAYWSFNEGNGATSYNSGGVSTTTLDGTLYGGIATSTSGSSGWVAGKYGTALAFDGVDDYVSIGDDKLRFQSDFTISAYIKIPNAADNPGGACVARYPIISNHDYGYNLLVNSTGKLSWSLYGNASVSSESSIVGDSFVHVAALREGMELALYIDGVLQGKDAMASASVNYGSGTTYPFVMGGYAVCGPDRFYTKGIIDEVKVYNYARTPDEIRLDYNAGLAAHFGPKSNCDDDPGSCMTLGLAGYWNFEEGSGTMAKDKSDNSNHGTFGTYMATGTPWTSGILPLSGGKKGGGALDFDGAADYVDMGNPSSLQMTNDLTIELWAKLDSTQVSAQYADMISHGHSSTQGWTFQFDHLSPPSTYVHMSNNGTTLYSLSYGINVFDDAWHHYMVTKSSVTGMHLYLDGKWINGNNSYTNPMVLQGSNFNIGRDSGTGNTRNAAGEIDEVRIYNRVLSIEEIRYHYNKGGPVGYWKFNEGSGTTVYDETPNNNDGTMYWMSTSTNGGWIEGKYGSALNFDATDDYVLVPDSDSLDLTSEITVSSWVKLNGVGSNGSVLSKQSFANNYILDYDAIYDTDCSGNGFQTGIAGTWLEFCGENLVAGVWYHVAFTWDGQHIRTYMDGVKTNEKTKTGTMTVGTDNLLIGLYEITAGSPFNGIIDEVKLYNYARSASQIQQDYNAGLSSHFK